VNDEKQKSTTAESTACLSYLAPIDKDNYWKAQDWTHSDADLSLSTGYSPGNVAMWRRRLKAPATTWYGPRRREQMQLRRQEWSTWDWTQQDVELAREHRCSREYIRRIRKKLGKPPSRRRGRSSRFGSLVLNVLEFSNLPGTEIAKKLHCSKFTIYTVARKQGFQFHRGLAAWPHVNWRLRNRDLAAIWGIKADHIRIMRYRKRHGPAQRDDPERYRQWLEEERSKAKHFRQSNQA
jgi:hypothetical protein